jgi:hypothetical protein
MTLSIMIFSITTLSIIILSIKTQNIMTIIISTFSTKKHSAFNKISKIQQNNIQHNDTQHYNDCIMTLSIKPLSITTRCMAIAHK